MTTAPFSISIIPRFPALSRRKIFPPLHRFVPKTALQLYSCKRRERDERVYRFSSIDEAIGVLSVVRRAW